MCHVLYLIVPSYLLNSEKFINGSFSEEKFWFQASLCWRVKLEKEVGRKKLWKNDALEEQQETRQSVCR